MKYMRLVGLISMLVLLSGVFSQKLTAVNLILNKALERNAEEAFQIWHHLHKRGEYGAETEEYRRRKEIFKKKFEEIKAWNADTTKTWKKGLNKFSDLSEEEFRRTYLISNMEEHAKMGNNRSQVLKSGGFTMTDIFVDRTPIAFFKDIDWREASGVPDDQLTCGSCYSFATINAIETNYFIATGERVRLSRQQIVDCDTLTKGCDGGWASPVGLYAKGYGLMKEADYPYTAVKGTCNYQEALASRVYIDGMIGHDFPSQFKDLKVYHPYYLYKQLQKGAVVVAIDGSSLGDYSEGIWQPEGCFSMNHAVLAVGFGVENGIPYWIIKNSWGQNWGEDGYIRMIAKESDSTGNCYLYYFTYLPYVHALK